MFGHTVRVLRRRVTGHDTMGEPLYQWDGEDVSNVLVRPLEGAQPAGDVVSDLRPDGVRVKFRLAFPKGYTGSLRHARVAITDAPWSQAPDDPEKALVVSGDPQPEDPCPTQWDRLVEVGRANG